MRHEVSGSEHTLVYTPREVTVGDLTLAHSSRGGSLESVWAGDLGGRYVEVTHLGDGPEGGELVLVDPDADTVVIGDLYEPDPSSVAPDWPVTIDLVLGLLTDATTVVTTHGAIDRERLEAFHQQLLGVLHG